MIKALSLTALVSVTGFFTAPAAVIWSGERDIAVPTTFIGVYLDLASGMASVSPDYDFNGSQINLILGGDGILNSARLLPARIGNEKTDPIMILPTAVLIDDQLMYGPVDNGASSGHIGSGPGQLISGERGFIAYQFDPMADGVYVFGWMEVTLTSGSSPGVIHQWAYSNTPGEPILTGTVPEPGVSAWFALLAAGLWKRRRNAPHQYFDTSSR